MLPFLKPRCAGVCYPKSERECLDFFKGWFSGKEAPPWKPAPNTHLDTMGCIVPHIDFRVTEHAYGWGYQSLLTAPIADTYLILGVGHNAQQEWSMDERSYKTPLGEIPAAADLIQDLTKEIPFPIMEDAKAHEGEHSIEFAVVALAGIRKLMGIETPFQFIPVLCGGLHEHLFLGMPPGPDHSLFSLASALRKLHQKMGHKLQIIVSIDGCHMGPRFKHSYAVTESRLEAAATWEKTLWDHVEKMAPDKFFNHLIPDANYRYFDGVGALALLMEMLNKKYKLRRTYYEQWHEPSDMSAVTFSSGFIKSID